MTEYARNWVFPAQVLTVRVRRLRAYRNATSPWRSRLALKEIAAKQRPRSPIFDPGKSVQPVRSLFCTEKCVPLHESLIDPSSPAWSDFLAQADHDFHHLPCYQSLSVTSGETPRAFLASNGEHQLLVPFVQRPIPVEIAGEDGLFDIVSAYGYPGPVSTRGAPPAFVREGLAAFEAALAEQRIVAGFIRLHTLLNDPGLFEGIGETVTHGPVVYIDLSKSEDALWADVRSRHVKDIELAKRKFELVVDGWDRLDDFITCYHESMARVNAGSFYMFSKEYFEGLRDCIGIDRIHLCLLLHEGKVACGTLVTEMNGLCQYHLSGTGDAYMGDRPSKLMLHLLSNYLRARGNRVFHLGGGVGSARDSLYLFKSGFSRLNADFCTWRLVGDPERYAALMARWRVRSGREPIADDAFFPQYRAPITNE